MRESLQKNLAGGFWFPFFQKMLSFFYDHLSLGQKWNEWLKNGKQSPKGAAEFYQFILFLIGLLWILFIDCPPHLILVTRPAQIIGMLVALYPITDLFIFALHWTFVASKPLKGVRRSLATFLLNLFEIAIYFSIVFVLARCYRSPRTSWSIVYDNIKAVFNAELIAVSENPCCQALAHYQLIIAVTLLAIVIASLVGGVLRKEDEETIDV